MRNHTILKALAASLMFALTPFAMAQGGPGGPRQADMPINAAQTKAVLDKLISEMNQQYVFPDTAAKLTSVLRANQQRGAYDKITSAEKLAELLTEQMQKESKDLHLRVNYSEQALQEQSADKQASEQEKAAELAGMKAQNFGIARVERLPFNIGYLELHMFAPPKEAANAIAAAMSLVANTDALIIDLRKNGGGDPETVALIASYLLEKRTRLNDMFFRDGNRTEQMWSSSKVIGERFGQAKDVYILASKHTFSAAEDFTYSLKNLKRVTVVGETTGGGAHPGDFVRLHPHFEVFLPNGRSISPITKTDWEGTGVTPDIATSAEEAMKTAQVLVLNKIIAAIKNPGKIQRIQARIAKVQAEDTKGFMDR